MSEYIEHKETDEATGLTFQIIADSDAVNPRKEFDNACTMCCDHGRYTLGDKDGHDKARDAIRGSKDYRETWEDPYSHKDGLDFEDGPSLFKAIQRCSDIIVLPLYLYDHSGITISTSPFHCPWDSGQVGFAFMTRDEVLYNYGVKRLTQGVRDKAFGLIRSEVEVYDQYLTGDVWGYVVENEAGEQVEACWGFYGIDTAREEGKSVFRSAIEHKAKDDALLDSLGVPAIA